MKKSLLRTAIEQHGGRAQAPCSIEVLATLTQVKQLLANIESRLSSGSQPSTLNHQLNSGTPLPGPGRETIILNAVANHFNITPGDIGGPARIEKFLWPRYIVITMLDRFTNLSTVQIGAFLGERTKNAIVHALAAADIRCQTELKSRLTVEFFSNMFQERFGKTTHPGVRA